MSLNPKKILSDVVVPVRKGGSSPNARSGSPPSKTLAPPPKLAHLDSVRLVQKPRRFRLKRVLIASGGIIALAAALIFGSLISAKMEVILTPRRITGTVEKTLTLAKNSNEPHDLSFSTISLAEARSGTFQATEKKKEGGFAQGTVVIFNKGKEPQVLITSSRLEAPNGRIYRIPRTIVIPAAGSMEVKVTANKAGAEYNLGLSDFTIPGLKGSPRYELVFGRSKTEISGGSAAEEIVVGKGDKDKAISESILNSQKEARNVLLKKLPDDEFLLLPSVEFVLVKETIDPPVGSAARVFDAKIEGEVRGAIVSRKNLEKVILKDHQALKAFSPRSLPRSGEAGGEVGELSLNIKNLEDLSFKLIGYKFDAASFKLHILGEAQVEATVDPDTLKLEIAERGFFNAGEVLSAFPELARAEIKVRPFWLRLFYKRSPKNPNRIDIILRPS